MHRSAALRARVFKGGLRRRQYACPQYELGRHSVRHRIPIKCHRIPIKCHQVQSGPSLTGAQLRHPTIDLNHLVLAETARVDGCREAAQLGACVLELIDDIVAQVAHLPRSQPVREGGR